MLNVLGYGDERFVVSEVKSILSQFNLFGFIIHDPKMHPEFHKQLHHSFDLLDYLSGKGFLFFAMVDAPQNSERYFKRDYFQWFERKQLLSPYNSYKTNDESITSFTLAQALGIDYDMLPVLVITRDFQSKEFTAVKTCPAYLEKQMQQIGFRCHEHYSKNLTADIPIKWDENEYSNLIESINYCGDSETLNLSNSLAVLLSDYMAFLVPDSNKKDFNVANIQIKNTITEFLNLDNKLPFRERDDKYLLSILGMLANYISHLKSGQFELAPAEPTYNINDGTFMELQQESKILLRTYAKILPVYSSLIKEITDINTNSLDYSPLLISLCKLFEIEINLSIVHWIRNYLEIEMPIYFNKRKNSFENYSIKPSREFVSNPREIDFNSGHQNKWTPPGIGESEFVARTLFKQGDYPKEFIPNYNQFLSLWSNIREYRNKTAHKELINKESFKDAQKHFKEFFEQKHLGNLMALKGDLKS